MNMRVGENVMIKHAKYINMFNILMIVGFIITMALFGDKPGAMNSIISAFFIYSLISPIVAVVGVVFGVKLYFKEGIILKTAILNCFILIGAVFWIYIIFVGGQSV